MLAAQQTASDNVALIVVALVVLVLVILLVFVILSLISQGALAESVAAIDRGERRHFWSAWRAGVSNFWSVLGQILLFILIGIGFLLVIGMPAAALVVGTFAVTDSPGAADIVRRRSRADRDRPVDRWFHPAGRNRAVRPAGAGGRRGACLDSIRGGYRLFWRNLGRSLLLWLIQVVLMLAAGIALVIAAILVGLALFIPTIILAVAEYATAAILTGVVAGLSLLPILLVASAILGTFNHSYWTLAYLRLSTPVGGATPQPDQGA
jgi:MFS family permease